MVHVVLRGAWRVGVFVVGVVLVIAGFTLLALPGPGLAVIALGLLVLASEFRWARRSLHVARTRVRAQFDRRRRRHSPA